MVNETNKLIWPAPNGIGFIDSAAFDNTVAAALSAVNESGASLITAQPPASAWTNEYIERALAALEAEGFDITGDSFSPIQVELLEGGN